MLWSQNTDTFILLFVFTFVFICSFVLEISPSHFTPWPRVCVPVQKKGRFVVVLSSHLRCSPFKRHRFSYKLCDCEWVGRGVREGGVPPVPPHPPSAPLTPGEYVPSPLLRARSAAQLLQHFPLAKIVLFNEHAETAFRPRFFICFPQTRKKRYRGSLEGGEGGNMHTQRHTNTCGNTQGRIIRNGWMAGRAVWLVRRGFRWQEEVFLIQSQVMFIEVENDCSPVEWLDPCQERENKFGRKKQKERENKRHTISKLRIFEIHNLVSLCIIENLKWTTSL